jgi:hypothetical protein
MPRHTCEVQLLTQRKPHTDTLTQARALDPSHMPDGKKITKQTEQSKQDLEVCIHAKA